MARNSYSEQNPLWILPPSLQSLVKSQPDLSLVDENELPATNSNEQKAHFNGEEKSRNSIEIGSTPVQPSPLHDDPVKKFNLDVANWIMSCLNKYYQYNVNRETCERKIIDASEYQQLAREFSRKHRKLEKESYLSVNGTLDGIEINLDMKDRLKLEIDMYFEKKPLLPLA